MSSDDFPLLGYIVLIAALTLVILSVLFHFYPPDLNVPTIINYEGVVVDVDGEKIVFGDGTVLFAYSTENFKYILNKSHDITIEQWNHSRMGTVKEVEVLR